MPPKFTNRSVDRNYFQSPHPMWWAIVPGGLYICFMSWYNPAYVQTMWYLGPVATLAHHLGTQYTTVMFLVNLFAWFAHAGEALYATQLCTQKGITDPKTVIKWLVQTFVFGFFSLKFLLKYKPRTN